MTLHHNAPIWGDKRTLTIRYVVQSIYFDIITITKVYDGEDTYRVQVSSSSGNNFINGDISTTLEARVYRGSKEITDSIAPALFSWTRKSDDETGDAVWNQLHEGSGNTVVVSDSDIFRKAVFECIVTITQ